MDKSQLRDLVADYLEHLRTDSEHLKQAGESIMMMTFLSPPQDQWEMVLEAVRQAQDDQDLMHVAAGPIEGLLGRHGKEVIDQVENQASLDPKFTRALTGVWKYLITDDVWKRVQIIQRCVSDPLDSYRPEI